MPRKKKGAGLNEHIENYIEEEEDFRPDQNLLDKHRNKYYKAYAEANGIPLKLKVKKSSGSMFKKSKFEFVINPVIVDSFNKKKKKTKLRKKEEEEERNRRQEEIIRRNLEKDKMKQAKQKLLTRSGAFQENETKEDKKNASQKFMNMRKTLKKRGPSKLRKTRKNPDHLSTNALTQKERDSIVREQMLNAHHSKMNQAAGRKRKRRRTKKKRRRKKRKTKKRRRR